LAIAAVVAVVCLFIFGHWIVAVGIVLVWAALVVGWWAFKKYQRFKLVYDFNGYCIECEKMLKKSGDHGDVMTIQTPVEEIPANAIDSFKSYLEKTFEVIIATERKYHRLVVLDNSITVPKTRIKDFINQLIDRAQKREITHPTIPFGLRNVEIGFVLSESVKDLIYSNTDIHCTTDRDFSIAFMAREAQKDIHFGSSLHLHDSKEILSKIIRNDLTTAWKKATCIVIGDVYPNFSGNGSTAKTEAQRDEIKVELDNRVNKIVDVLRP
jgi:hypothetical protein